MAYSITALPRGFSESQNVIHLVGSSVPLDPSLDFAAATADMHGIIGNALQEKAADNH